MIIQIYFLIGLFISMKDITVCIAAHSQHTSRPYARGEERKTWERKAFWKKGLHGPGIVEGARLSRTNPALLQDMKTTVRHNLVLNTFPCFVQLLTHSKAGRSIR